MSSRDPNYLTLRHLQCYESDDTYVSTSLVLTAGPIGVGTWTPGSQVTGTTGTTGPTGMTGMTGTTGTTGPFGYSYDGCTGPTGIQGDVGTVGTFGHSDTGSVGPSTQTGSTGTFGGLAPIAEGVATVPANTSSLFVADSSITSDSMIVVFPLNWDSTLTNIQVYLNPGTGFTIAVSSPTLIFSTPGTYTDVPVSSPFNFEMIGAGGNGDSGGIGGGGGYIQGTVTSPGTTSVNVIVGASGSLGNPSNASYINTTTQLFAMGGAGGASAPSAGIGGGAGGGSFSGGIAPGFNGISNFFGCPAGQGGQGGQVASGGAAGLSCLGVILGNPGGSHIVGTYVQAPGGAGAIGIGDDYIAGGSGYTGGGSGSGGGGGSSFVDSTYVSGVVSYDGNSVPGGTLPGYGRSNQGGYVSITSTWPAIDVRWWILRY